MPEHPRRPCGHAPHLRVNEATSALAWQHEKPCGGDQFWAARNTSPRLPEGTQLLDGTRRPDGYPPEGTQLLDGTRASSTGTTPRQMKAGSEHSPSGTTSLTPKEAARFSAARKRSRLILAAWA